MTSQIILKNMNYKDLKKLHKQSRTITLLAMIWLLLVYGMCFLAISLLNQSEKNDDIAGNLLGVSLVYFIGLIFTFKRHKWGKNIGTGLSGVLCCAFPAGTCLGALGLITFPKSAVLFGADRIKPKELKAELKYRKKSKHFR